MRRTNGARLGRGVPVRSWGESDVRTGTTRTGNKSWVHPRWRTDRSPEGPEGHPPLTPPSDLPDRPCGDPGVQYRTGGGPVVTYKGDF